MKNVNPAVDFINLPEYVAGPPAEPHTNWGFKPKPLSPAASATIARLKVLNELEGLKAADLLFAFVVRRVLPLQGRPHIISPMSGHHDPCRMCTKEMPTAEVAYLVNEIVNLKLEPEGWQFSKRPYSRVDLPPMVSSQFCYFLLPGSLLPGSLLLASFSLASPLPADQPDHDAGPPPPVGGQR